MIQANFTNPNPLIKMITKIKTIIVNIVRIFNFVEDFYL